MNFRVFDIRCLVGKNLIWLVGVVGFVDCVGQSLCIKFVLHVLIYVVFFWCRVVRLRILSCTSKGKDTLLLGGFLGLLFLCRLRRAPQGAGAEAFFHCKFRLMDLFA